MRPRRNQARPIEGAHGKATSPRQRKYAYDEGDDLPVTTRHKDVLRLLAQDNKVPDIARELGVTSETVKSHIREIKIRTHKHTLQGLVAWAYEHGVVDPLSLDPERD
jgi:DNA-binding NarL/FixJ family response regulator